MVDCEWGQRGPKGTRTTISLSFEAKEALEFIRESGMSFNASEVCSRAILSAATRLRPYADLLKQARESDTGKKKK